MIYCIEGNFGNGKIWRMQHINIFGGIKFGESVKAVCVSAHLHIFIIQTNIQSYCNLQTKREKSTWWCMHAIYGLGLPLYSKWSAGHVAFYPSGILHFWNIHSSFRWIWWWHIQTYLTGYLGWAIAHLQWIS